jgi:ABC-type multidrug transport system fused ATPase/permease subunit
LSRGEKNKYRLGLFTDSISQIAMSFVSIYFIMEVVHGKLTIGNLTFLLASVANLHGAFSNFFNFLGKQYQDSLFVTDLFKLIDQKPSVNYKKEGIVLDEDTPKIEFKNVSFKYPNTDKIVLKNFNLTINPGEKIAIVGINGAGKTTMVKLLSRFYDPIEGKILIGGYDLRDLEINAWYDKLSILSQEYIKYYLLAKEAIGVGDVKKMFNDKLIKEAAKASEAHAFIEE